MENAADALKMAGAAMLFILAFTLTIYMFTKARSTSDAVLDSLQASDFLSRVDALDTNETREVGIETIIPTIYRYASSDANIRVRILDKNGDELQVFDTGIESQISSTISRTSYSNLTAEQKDLNDRYNKSDENAYMFGAPWANDEDLRLERINAYIYGTKAKHMESVNYSNNYLMKYKEETFIESYVEYNTSGQVYTDEYGEEIVMIPASVKTIITYKLLEK